MSQPKEIKYSVARSVQSFFFQSRANSYAGNQIMRLWKVVGAMFGLVLASCNDPAIEATQNNAVQAPVTRHDGPTEDCSSPVDGNAACAVHVGGDDLQTQTKSAAAAWGHAQPSPAMCSELPATTAELVGDWRIYSPYGHFAVFGTETFVDSRQIIRFQEHAGVISGKLVGINPDSAFMLSMVDGRLGDEVFRVKRVGSELKGQFRYRQAPAFPMPMCSEFRDVWVDTRLWLVADGSVLCTEQTVPLVVDHDSCRTVATSRQHAYVQCPSEDCWSLQLCPPPWSDEAATEVPTLSGFCENADKICNNISRFVGENLPLVKINPVELKVEKYRTKKCIVNDQCIITERMIAEKVLWKQIYEHNYPRAFFERRDLSGTLVLDEDGDPIFTSTNTDFFNQYYRTIADRITTYKDSDGWYKWYGRESGAWDLDGFIYEQFISGAEPFGSTSKTPVSDGFKPLMETTPDCMIALPQSKHGARMIISRGEYSESTSDLESDLVDNVFQEEAREIFRQRYSELGDVIFDAALAHEKIHQRMCELRIEQRGNNIYKIIEWHEDEIRAYQAEIDVLRNWWVEHCI